MVRLIICSVLIQTNYDVRERRTGASCEISCIPLKVGGGKGGAEVQSHFMYVGADSVFSSCVLSGQICTQS